MAITIDSTSKANVVGSSSPITISHTCAVGARLYVCVSGLPPVGDTSVTYNGIALTKARASTTVNSSRVCEIWYTDTPTSGTNNIVVTHSTNNYLSAYGISFAGAATASLGALADNAVGTATSLSNAITSTAANSYLLTCYYLESSGTLTTSGGETSVSTQTNDTLGGYTAAATTILTTTAGSYTPAGSDSASTQWRMVTVEIKPPVTLFTKTLTETVTYTDVLTHSHGFFRTFSETIIYSDIVTATRRFLKVLSETLTFSDSLTTAVHHLYSVVLSEVLTFTDVLQRALNGFVFIVWNPRTILPTSWTNRAKPTTSFTKRTKPTSNWTPREKP